jgi:hypothetical protein
MPRKQRRDIRVVVGEARDALGMTQQQFGYAVGASHRSAVRWDAGQATPDDASLRKMAELLVARDRALAAEVADFLDETLESLGLVAPPPPPAPPPPAPAAFVPPARDLVDVVVLAAMEASGLPAAQVRTLLHTVFRRAKDVALTVEAVEEALRPAVPRAPATDEKRSDEARAAGSRRSARSH